MSASRFFSASLPMPPVVDSTSGVKTPSLIQVHGDHMSYFFTLMFLVHSTKTSGTVTVCIDFKKCILVTLPETSCPYKSCACIGVG